MDDQTITNSKAKKSILVFWKSVYGLCDFDALGMNTLAIAIAVSQ